MGGELAIRGVLETCVYADDLAAAERFYGRVLGLDLIARRPERHVFFRCGDGVFLVFNPDATSGAPAGPVPDGGPGAPGSREDRGGGGDRGGVPSDEESDPPVPAHGARGPGHAAFAVPEAELAAWRERLARHGVPVEAEVEWPGGGRSLYLRDPAGNCIELASPAVWGNPDKTPREEPD